MKKGSKYHSSKKQPFPSTLPHYNFWGCFLPPFWSHRGWDSGGTPVGLRWTLVKSGGTPMESSGKQGVGGCWVSLGPKFGPEPKFEPELLRTRSKFSPKFSILLN